VLLIVTKLYAGDGAGIHRTLLAVSQPLGIAQVVTQMLDKRLGCDIVVRREVLFKLRNGFRELTAGTSEVTVREVVEGDCGLNQSLVKNPVRTCRIRPQLFPGIVCLEKELIVEFLDTPFKEPMHRGST
jgi:hypothetical protein